MQISDSKHTKKKPKKKIKSATYDFTNGRKGCKGCDREDDKSWELMEGKTFENKAA